MPSPGMKLAHTATLSTNESAVPATATANIARRSDRNSRMTAAMSGNQRTRERMGIVFSVITSPHHHDVESENERCAKGNAKRIVLQAAGLHAAKAAANATDNQADEIHNAIHDI